MISSEKSGLRPVIYVDTAIWSISVTKWSACVYSCGNRYASNSVVSVPVSVTIAITIIITITITVTLTPVPVLSCKHTHHHYHYRRQYSVKMPSQSGLCKSLVANQGSMWMLAPNCLPGSDRLHCLFLLKMNLNIFITISMEFWEWHHDVWLDFQSK